MDESKGQDSREIISSRSTEPSSQEDLSEARQQALIQVELQKTEPPVLPITTLFRKQQHKDLDQVATQPSVFDDPELAKHFQPTEKYENLHRFDPSARWTWAEELPLINKIDWKITAWACIAFFALDLDRGNLNQANTDNFLDDLGMNTNGTSEVCGTCKFKMLTVIDRLQPRKYCFQNCVLMCRTTLATCEQETG